MTPQYILKKSLCREPHCASGATEQARLSQIEDMSYARSYAEPGYRAQPKGILFANWNYFPRRIDSILEDYGYSVEWSDEWSTCDECGRAVRTSPDCYSWTPYYLADLEDSGLMLCLDCVDWTSYLTSIEDQHRKAVNNHLSRADMERYGYRLVSEPGQYENGLHHGQNDNPKKILEDLHSKGKTGIVFRVSGVGQFDIAFEVWQKISEPETGEETSELAG